MLTIAYLTFRENPRFEWFASSLKREFRDTPGTDSSLTQVVVIDGRYPRKLEADFPFDHRSPKPTVWQGTHRLTRRDYFCAANTRNTALAIARHGHVVFVDDLSVLAPGWLKAHLHAAANGYVLCGTTHKRKKIEVSSEGEILRSEELVHGTDSRMRYLVDDSLFRCGGGWLYGGTFSVPLEHALRVNGQDEICDSIGGEDYDFGQRLERAGSEIYITRTCGTIEDEDAHHTQETMIRLDKPWPDLVDGPYSSNRLLNRLRRESDRVWTLGNSFVLREMRDRVLSGEPFPIPVEPTTHWVDGQPLSEM